MQNTIAYLLILWAVGHMAVRLCPASLKLKLKINVWQFCATSAHLLKQTTWADQTSQKIKHLQQSASAAKAGSCANCSAGCTSTPKLQTLQKPITVLKKTW
jgi:hypothetical protein